MGLTGLSLSESGEVMMCVSVFCFIYSKSHRLSALATHWVELRVLIVWSLVAIAAFQAQMAP